MLSASFLVALLLVPSGAPPKVPLHSPTGTRGTTGTTSSDRRPAALRVRNAHHHEAKGEWPERRVVLSLMSLTSLLSPLKTLDLSALGTTGTSGTSVSSSTLPGLRPERHARFSRPELRGKHLSGSPESPPWLPDRISPSPARDYPSRAEAFPSSPSQAEATHLDVPT